MYGLIGKMTAQPGKRAELLDLFRAGMTDMPGCLLYHIAADLSAPDVIWITESWQSREAHAASLTLPQVKALIGRARPLIAGLERIAETEPLA